MASEEQIIAANRATIDAWNAHDAEAVAAVFADVAVIRDVAPGEPVRGRHAIRDRVAGMMAAFPDLELRQLDLVVGEDVNFWDVPTLLAQLTGEAGQAGPTGPAS